MKIASKLIRLSAITLSLTSLAIAADSKPNIIVIMADDVGHERATIVALSVVLVKEED